MAGPPVARIDPVTEDLYGTKVTDRYRWMEAEGPEWKAYAMAEGDYARQVLGAIPGRDALLAQVQHYTHDLVAVSAVQVGGDNIFTQVRPAGADTFKLYVRKGPHGSDRMLIDPDAHAPAGSHASLDWWAASPDGSHVVFGLSPGGSENSVAHIIVTETGAMLPEAIDRTENASPSWAADGSGFFYNRLQPGVSPDSLDKYKLSAAWFHRLNTDPASDVKVLAKGSAAVEIADIDLPVVAATPGSDVALGFIESGVQNEVGLYAAVAAAAQAGSPSWVKVCSAADKVTSAVVHGPDIFLLSHAGASHYKVLKATAASPAVATARLVVPESASVIRGITAARDALYINDLNAGLAGLRRMAWDGTVATVALPFAGSIDAVYADTLHDGVWFLLQGWVRPSVLCFVGPDGVVVQTDIAPAPPIDVTPYVAEEVFATAADGVKVPLSIVYRKGLARDGSAPTLLDAYGAYGITEDPAFLAHWLPLLDLGGVFAIAHVRGGGELGEDWHLAGQKLNKPNTWRDMIASAHYLIDSWYTRSAKLVHDRGPEPGGGGDRRGRGLQRQPQRILAERAAEHPGIRHGDRSHGFQGPLRDGRLSARQGWRGLSVGAVDHGPERPARLVLGADQDDRPAAGGHLVEEPGAAAHRDRRRTRHRLDAQPARSPDRRHPGLPALAHGRPALPAGLGVDPRLGRTAQHLDAVLVDGDDVELDQFLAALVADRLDGGGGVQRVARPDLAGEAHAVLGQARVANIVGQHLAGHAHGQHAVGEDRRIAGHLGGEDLVGVQRVIVARRPGVLDDLGALQVLDQTRGVGVAFFQLAGAQCHGWILLA
jgi:prolyl oligopeptidase